VPMLGYETASEIAKEALATGQGVYDILCDRGLMTREELDRALNPETMVQGPELLGARAGVRTAGAGGGDGANGGGSGL